MLATWDGTTVAQNGGSYLATNDPNNTAEENNVKPLAAQSQFITGWTQISKTQHCEITGPGGIFGNPKPATDTTTITVDVDFLADNTWFIYQAFELAAGQTFTHAFPPGFHAHWVRVKSSAATTATAQFTYGPAEGSPHK